MTKRKGRNSAGSSPVTMLTSELAELRRDLRQTVKAYAQRLEADLLKSSAAVSSLGPIEKLSPENLHDVREMTVLVRRRRLKPEKGRRKDLRKIDALIEDLQLFVPANAHPREYSERLL